MRFMVMVRATKDSENGVMPSEKLLADMGKFNEELVKAGVMLAGEGLQPSSKGARIRFEGSKRSVIDGPFAETKELIGGWAILEAPTKEAALVLAKEFMELHVKYWPEFEGESEMRPMFEPGMGP